MFSIQQGLMRYFNWNLFASDSRFPRAPQGQRRYVNIHFIASLSTKTSFAACIPLIVAGNPA